MIGVKKEKKKESSVSPGKGPPLQVAIPDGSTHGGVVGVAGCGSGNGVLPHG